MNELGPCCCCGTESGAIRTLAQLDFEAPTGFNGWGCVQCGAPSRGAIAVLCDACARPDNDAPLRFICGGTYVADGQRVPLEGYERRPFGHELSKHPEIHLS